MNDRSACPAAPTPLESLRRRAEALNLNGLLAHWPDAGAAPWVQELIQWEEQERAAEASSAASGRPASAGSNPCATSTGAGPPSATEPLSRS